MLHVKVVCINATCTKTSNRWSIFNATCVVRKRGRELCRLWINIFNGSDLASTSSLCSHSGADLFDDRSRSSCLLSLEHDETNVDKDHRVLVSVVATVNVLSRFKTTSTWRNAVLYRLTMTKWFCRANIRFDTQLFVRSPYISFTNRWELSTIYTHRRFAKWWCYQGLILFPSHRMINK